MNSYLIAERNFANFLYKKSTFSQGFAQQINYEQIFLLL